MPQDTTSPTHLLSPEKTFFYAIQFILNDLNKKNDTPKYCLEALNKAMQQAVQLCKDNPTTPLVNAYNTALQNFERVINESQTNLDNLVEKYTHLTEASDSPDSDIDDIVNRTQTMQTQLRDFLSQVAALQRYQEEAHYKLASLFEADTSPGNQNMDAIYQILKQLNDNINTAQEKAGHVKRSYALENIEISIHRNLKLGSQALSILIKQYKAIIARAYNLAGKESPISPSDTSSADSSDIEESEEESETESDGASRITSPTLRREGAGFFAGEKQSRSQSANPDPAPPASRHRTEDHSARSRSPSLS